MTIPPSSNGCPYTALSRCARHATVSLPGCVTPAAVPLRALSRWNVTQSDAPTATGVPVAVACGIGFDGFVDAADGDVPPPDEHADASAANAPRAAVITSLRLRIAPVSQRPCFSA